MGRTQQTLLVAFAVMIALGAAHEASGQAFPAKPIRVVTSAPGGANDIAIRVIGDKLKDSLGQPIVVENRGGASATVVAAQAVTRATADGHTLLFYSNSLWTDSLLRGGKLFDPAADFAPITMAVSSPNIVVVHPSTQVRSIKELIALAKSRPGDLDYSSGALGSSNHLAAELFRANAGVKVNRVGYRGTPPALNAVISGEVQLMFPVAAAALPHLSGGRIRALAVTSPRPSVLAPGLPTVAASGLPGYESEMMMALFAPAETPAPVLSLLAQEMAKVLRDPTVVQGLLKLSFEPIGSTPAQLVTAVRGEVSRLARVIKQADIKAN